MNPDDPASDSSEPKQPQPLEPQATLHPKRRRALVAIAVLSSAVALVSIGLLAFTLLAEPRLASYSTASQSNVACSDSVGCETAPNAPVCGDTQCSVCDTSVKKCIYRLKANDPACACLQYDVELCTLDAGGWGVRKCRVTVDGTGTYWGRCSEL